MSELVGSPEDRFSRVAAQMVSSNPEWMCISSEFNFKMKRNWREHIKIKIPSPFITSHTEEHSK